jgi:predicted aspartyl protease
MKRLAVVVLATLIGCSAPGETVQVSRGAARGGNSQDLGGILAQMGYARVEMVRLPTGHFSIGGSAAEVTLELIVDTGASHTVIDLQRAERFALATEDRGSRATGIGMSSQRVESGRLDDVALGPVRFDSLRVTVLDLSHVNQVLRRLGNEPVDGIIGADVLMAQRAVIDYGTLSLYFKE